MQDEPTPAETDQGSRRLSAQNEIAPVIKGHNAFKLRVGINALELVTAANWRWSRGAMPPRRRG